MAKQVESKLREQIKEELERNNEEQQKHLEEKRMEMETMERNIKAAQAEHHKAQEVERNLHRVIEEKERLQGELKGL